MGNVEGTLEGTSIGILSFAIENSLKQINVVRINGTVEGDGDHLRNLGRINVARDSGTIRRTKAIWKLTLAQVAVWSAVGILIDCASIFIGSVRAVLSFITEKFFVNTFPISTLKLTVRADGFVGLQIGEDSARLCINMISFSS